MRLLHTLLLCCLFQALASANTITEAERQYFIENYSLTAVNTMHSVGIPASITLGQAILESNWGQGETAVNANNFFCIKCNNGWEGDTYYAWDDETQKSCFRAYGDIAGSFSDHSNFLRSSARYTRLFQLESTNYSAWANGLQECGYATDLQYAEKLIRLIESYGLFIYDYAVPTASFQSLTTPVGSLDYSPFEMTVPQSGSHMYVGKPETKRPVMKAPEYRMEIPRKQISNPAISQGFSFEAEESQKADQDRPLKQPRKIRPIYPLPDVKWE